MNRIVFVTRFVILFFSFSLGALSLMHTTQLPSTKSALLKYLDELEKLSWQKLETHGINQQICENVLYEELKKSKKNKSVHDKCVPQEIKMLIHNVMCDFGMQFDHINIQVWDDLSPAGATSTTLFINLQEFKKLTPKSQKFAIAHELQHVKFLDTKIRSIILDSIDESKANSTKEDEPLNIYKRFQEKRADIKAALHGLEYAEGYLEFMQTWMRPRKNSLTVTHPKFSERLQIAQSILKNLYQQNIMLS